MKRVTRIISEVFFKMFKILRDKGIRLKAGTYIKNSRYQKRLLSTNEDFVSSADVVVIGKYFL